MAKKRKKVTKYQRMQRAAKKACENSTKETRAKYKAAASAYIDDAVKKGKTKTEAREIANKTGKCNRK